MHRDSIEYGLRIHADLQQGCTTCASPNLVKNAELAVEIAVVRSGAFPHAPSRKSHLRRRAQARTALGHEKTTTLKDQINLGPYTLS